MVLGDPEIQYIYNCIRKLTWTSIFLLLLTSFLNALRKIPLVRILWSNTSPAFLAVFARWYLCCFRRHQRLSVSLEEVNQLCDTIAINSAGYREPNRINICNLKVRGRTVGWRHVMFLGMFSVATYYTTAREECRLWSFQLQQRASSATCGAIVIHVGDLFWAQIFVAGTATICGEVLPEFA